MTDPARCPACGVLVEPDGDRWPDHPPSPEQRIGEETYGPDKRCASWLVPLALLPPAAEPDKAGQWAPRCEWPNPAMRLAVAMARYWYSLPGQSTGGIYHVVLDDGNLEAHWIEDTRDRCIAAGYALGVELGQRLLGLTYGQRRWVYREHSADRWPDLGRRSYLTGWSIDGVTDRMCQAVILPYAVQYADLPHDDDPATPEDLDDLLGLDTSR